MKYLLLTFLTTSLFAETFRMMPDPYNYQTGYKVVHEEDGSSGITLELPPDVDGWKASNIVNWKITSHKPSYSVKFLPPDDKETGTITLKASGRIIGYLLITDEEDKPIDPEKALKAALK